MKDILLQADPVLDFDNSEDWIKGWERPIHRHLTNSIAKNSPFSSDLSAIFTDVLAQIAKLKTGSIKGGGGLEMLLRLIADQCGTQDRGEAISTLNAFTVPDGNTFSKWLQLFKIAASNATQYGETLSPDDSWITEVTVKG